VTTDTLQPLRTARAGVLEVAYHEAGPDDGEAVLLLHGFPYDIHSYVDVVPVLADAGLRVIVPYLRGHGPTRFVDPATPRSGQQAALGADVLELMDALDIPRALLAGYDWGGRAAPPPRRRFAPSSKPASGTSSTSPPSAAGSGSPRTGETSPG
jgi:alpha-beta hydrolase superfamily lysophospholipase